jgi:plasmid replication initiation protein
MHSEYLVTKSNALICANYNLSSQEQKIILTLASLVQPDDKEFHEYVFKIKDFSKLLGIENRYREVALLTKNLMKKVFEIKEGNSLKQMAWLCGATYKIGEGTVILKFSPDLKPYLLQLKTFYTKYKLKNVLSLKSKYSIRMYEILKCNAFKKQVIISLQELKNMLGANANYFNSFKDFKKRVLLQAQREINSITDLSFEFEEIRTSRKITDIKFTITNSLIELDDFDGYSEEDVCLIKERIEILTQSQITYKSVYKLLDEKGKEKINWYLDNYKKFKVNKHNPAGFLIKAILEEYPIPDEEINNYHQKPIQSTNFEQRVYDDEYFESLYENFKK